jgi:hypothetical protein
VTDVEIARFTSGAREIRVFVRDAGFGPQLALERHDPSGRVAHFDVVSSALDDFLSAVGEARGVILREYGRRWLAPVPRRPRRTSME